MTGQVHRKCSQGQALSKDDAQAWGLRSLARKIRKPERVGLRIFMTGKPASSGKESTTLNDTEFSQFLKGVQDSCGPVTPDRCSGRAAGSA